MTDNRRNSRVYAKISQKSTNEAGTLETSTLGNFLKTRFTSHRENDVMIFPKYRTRLIPSGTKQFAWYELSRSNTPKHHHKCFDSCPTIRYKRSQYYLTASTRHKHDDIGSYKLCLRWIRSVEDKTSDVRQNADAAETLQDLL